MTSETRPVLYIIDASVDITGAFVCARNEARLLRNFVRVVIVLPEESRIPEEELADFHRVLRLPIVNLRRSAGAVLRYGPSLLRVTYLLRRAMRADGAERLQLNDFFLMHGAVLRSLGFSGRIVTIIRFDPRRFGRVLSRLWLRLTFRTSDRVVSVSRFIQSVLPAGHETTLVYDTLPDRARDAEPPVADLAKPTRRRLVFLGNYIEGKGQDDALEAFAQIAPRFADLDLHFYGGDMGLERNRLYRSALKEQARSFGLVDRVVFHGFTESHESFRGAYAALNFSHSESFSMTCLEASAAGLPVVATRSGGPEEIIKDGVTGILVPVGDIDAMAHAMTTLAEHPDDAATMGARGRERVLDLFSTEEYRRRMIDVLGLATTCSAEDVV